MPHEWYRKQAGITGWIAPDGQCTWDWLLWSYPLATFSAKLGDLSKILMIGHARFVCDSSPPLLPAQAPNGDSLALGTTVRPRNDASFL